MATSPLGGQEGEETMEGGVTLLWGWQEDDNLPQKGGTAGRRSVWISVSQAPGPERAAQKPPAP